MAALSYGRPSPLPPHMTSAPSLAIFRRRLITLLSHLSYPDRVILLIQLWTLR